MCGSSARLTRREPVPDEGRERISGSSSRLGKRDDATHNPSQSREFVTQGRVSSLVRFAGNRRARSANRLEGSHTMSRAQLTRGFLWFSVLGWGIGLGPKLFDLSVVARAWGDAPPTSLTLMPYGRRYPMNPGDFFQP